MIRYAGCCWTQTWTDCHYRFRSCCRSLPETQSVLTAWNQVFSFKPIRSYLLQDAAALPWGTPAELRLKRWYCRMNHHHHHYTITVGRKPVLGPIFWKADPFVCCVNEIRLTSLFKAQVQIIRTSLVVFQESSWCSTWLSRWCWATPWAPRTRARICPCCLSSKENLFSVPTLLMILPSHSSPLTTKLQNLKSPNYSRKKKLILMPLCVGILFHLIFSLYSVTVICLNHHYFLPVFLLDPDSNSSTVSLYSN